MTHDALRGPAQACGILIRSRQVAIKVYIDGALYDERDARISVFDRGFLYGDSVYEVMRTSGGRPVELALHLERLGRSADAIALEAPPSDAIADAVAASLRAADNDESYIRVIVTRGSGEIGLETSRARQPALLVIVRPLALPPASAYAHGVKLGIVEVRRTPRQAMDPSVKTGNYLNNIMALHQARQAGADEALMCDAQGRVAEGASSNVFAIRGGRAVTPALDIGLLAGITRRRVIELARGDGIEVTEGVLMPADVRGADEVFITSSIRGVLPVAAVDGVALGQGAPGPMTQRIMTLYARHLARCAEAP
jgi:branched-chain amino acid aminotransferase